VIKIGDLVMTRSQMDGTKRMGIVIGFDTKHGTPNIKVQWPPEYCGEPLWATPWQLEVISASR